MKACRLLTSSPMAKICQKKPGGLRPIIARKIGGTNPE